MRSSEVEHVDVGNGIIDTGNSVQCHWNCSDIIQDVYNEIISLNSDLFDRILLTYYNNDVHVMNNKVLNLSTGKLISSLYEYNIAKLKSQTDDDVLHFRLSKFRLLD